MAGSAEVKERQEQHWDRVASGWGAWLEWTERNFQPLTAWFRDAAGWASGVRLLDVACGAGYPALAAAKAVRPDGKVVATDISTQMLAVAGKRAGREALDNIELVQMDAEAMLFRDASFDAVTNAYGLMFCPDPPRAVSEAHRVLVDGGRLALATWDDPGKSPFFTAIRGVAERFLGLSEPPPHEPHPFRLASCGAIRSMLQAAGFADIRVESVPMTFESESVDEYIRMFSDLAWRSRIDALDRSQAARFQNAVAESVGPYLEGGRVRLVATSICASARRL